MTGWKAGRAATAGVAVVLATGILLYRGVLVKLVRDWSGNDDYSHGFLIVPLALYFAWRQRDHLARLRPSPSNLGLLVVVAGLATLGAGVLGAELFLQRASLLLVIAGTVAFLLGWAHLRTLAFPVLFLLLMIPIPAIVFNQLAFPLQLLASQAGELTLRAAGIPVLREGNVITLSTTTLQVAEACSGIRSLISLLTLSIVFGYFTLRRPVSRVWLAAASVPVAIAANAARVAGTGLAAHQFGPRAAEGFFHTFSGWLVFLVAFLLLSAVRVAIVRVVPECPPPAPATPAEPTARVGRTPRRLAARSAAVAALFLLGGVAIADASRTEPVLPRQSLATFPSRLAGWQGEPTVRFDQQVLAVLGVDEYINRIYRSPDGQPIGLYVGYYASQRQGDTIHSPLNCLPGAGWEPVTRRRVSLEVAGARPIVVNRLLIRKGIESQVVIYWYQGHGRVIASEYWGKIYAVIDAIRLNRTDGALVRIVSPVLAADPEGERRAEQVAFGFLTAAFPVLERHLPE
jgi:exosortase D (VPLPA-CTERM-specific)